jgi:hypothetical protein
MALQGLSAHTRGKRRNETTQWRKLTTDPSHEKKTLFKRMGTIFSTQREGNKKDFTNLFARLSGVQRPAVELVQGQTRGTPGAILVRPGQPVPLRASNGTPAEKAELCHKLQLSLYNFSSHVSFPYCQALCHCFLTVRKGAFLDLSDIRPKCNCGLHYHWLAENSIRRFARCPKIFFGFVRPKSEAIIYC